MSDLDDFWNQLDRDFLKEHKGWEFERDGNLLYLSLSARDGERYRIRFGCDGYRTRPPDPMFVDADGSKTAVTAWPRGNDNFYQYIKRPPDCFICMPLSRNGLERHQEWLTSGVGAWNPATHSLFDLFNFFQRLLDSTDYSGR